MKFPALISVATEGANAGKDGGRSRWWGPGADVGATCATNSFVTKMARQELHVADSFLSQLEGWRLTASL